MKPLRPRALVHRGIVLAHGLAIDVSQVGEARARERALDAWSPGAHVFRAGRWMLVRFAVSATMNADVSPGAPLVRIAARACAAPFSAAEIARIGAPPEAFVLVEEGGVVALDATALPEEDPSRWLDMSAYRAMEVAPLGDLPAAVVASPAARDARALLGIGAPSVAQEEAAAALRSARSSRSAASAWTASLLGLVLVLARRLAAFFSARAASSPTTAALAIPRNPSAARIGAWLKRLAASLLLRARLGHLVGERHAEHLRRVLAMLDEGDYAEALRHAVPIGGASDPTTEHIALGPAARRDSLAIHAHATRASAIVPMARDVQEHLRAAYRRTVDRLVALGRHGEAAFVLAELLHAEAEAVELLEKSGQLRLAAELAEARGLPAGLVVRQWFVAGDIPRAVRIARRTGAFADAVTRLERRSRDDADALRLAWAESSASAGDYTTAVQLAWRIERARPLAHRWIDLALASDGPAAAAVLPRKLVIDPDALPDVRARADALCADPSSAVTLAESLLDVSPVTPEARVLARRTLRALLRLRSLDGDRKARLVGRLAQLADDAALRADLPPPSRAEAPLAVRREPRMHDVQRRPATAPPIHDAVRLPNGRTLLALGEAGLRLVSREGRTLFHLDEPAHAIVVSDHGDRAILVARRGAGVRLARADLVGRRVEPWCDARLDSWAPDFDGAEWFVAQEGTVSAIDALGERGLVSTWSVALGADSDTGGPIRLARSRTELAFDAPAAQEIWRYALPTMTLRARTPVEADRILITTALAPNGDFAWLGIDADDGTKARLKTNRGPIAPLSSDAILGTKGRIALRDGWLAATARDTDGDATSCVLFDATTATARARVRLRGASDLTPRIFGGWLTVHDGAATIVHVDLDSGVAAVLTIE